MKLSIFGSCRQDSLYKLFDVTNIKNQLSYPHYSKEIIQCVKFCKNKSDIPKHLTRHLFRSGILNKSEICYDFKNDFETTDLFVVEIASRKTYNYQGFYAHHILTDEAYGFDDRSSIHQGESSDEEIERDILLMRELFNGKPFIIVGHICTRKTGKRYELLNLLRNICDAHTIPFFDPQEQLADCESMFVQEDPIAHYTEKGHTIIGELYKKFIDKVIQTPLPSIQTLTVYKSFYPKYRCGSKGDGGYVIANLQGYDALFACGISDNIEFEIEFLEKYPIPCYGFDGTIDCLRYLSQPLIKFHKLNIGHEITEKTTNLHSEIEAYNNIFLKIDIETFEYRWLRSLSIRQLLRFKQIVIEFHFPFTSYPFNHLDIQLPVYDKLVAIKTLCSTHTLIHIHGNNCCGTTLFDSINVPNVFECTFVRNDIQNREKLNTINIPNTLDSANAEGPDINMSFPPFVF